MAIGCAYRRRSDAYPGGIQGLVGLNGSGKTTTLECMLGLQRYDQGEVSVLTEAD